MAKQRKINAAAFQKQIAESVIGDDSMLEIEVDAGKQTSVWVKLPVNLSSDDEYRAKLARCVSDEDMCLEALSHKVGVDADEQWKIWLDAWAPEGDMHRAAKLLLNIIAAEAADAEERAKNFRYRG